MTPAKAGTLAYLDSFAGLIPCVVTEVTKPGPGTSVAGPDAPEVTVRITGRSRGGYSRGEIISRTPGHRVLPRTHVHGMRRMSGPRLSSDYRWE